MSLNVHVLCPARAPVGVARAGRSRKCYRPDLGPGWCEGLVEGILGPGVCGDFGDCFGCDGDAANVKSSSTLTSID